MKTRGSLIVLGICLALLASSCTPPVQPVVFGDWDGESAELGRIRSEFSSQEPLNCSIDFGEPVGTGILVFTLVCQEIGLVETWEQIVKPEMTWFTYGFWDTIRGDKPLDPGLHVLLVQKGRGGPKIAEGSFTIRD